MPNSDNSARLIIENPQLCMSCTKKSCSISDVIERQSITRFRTERYVCPVRLIINGPETKQLECGHIDGTSSDAICIYCGLCVKRCHHNNLSISNQEFSTDNDFTSLRILDEALVSSNANIVALAYLNSLFDFAANTNINKALAFDGYLCDNHGEQCFVEVDLHDDSLEACRRVLADIAMQSSESSKGIRSGVMVLSHIPRVGSRDIHSVLDSIKKHPYMADLTIYITTFSILRRAMYVFDCNSIDLDEIMYVATKESIDTYIKRLANLLSLSDDEVNCLFG